MMATILKPEFDQFGLPSSRPFSPSWRVNWSIKSEADLEMSMVIWSHTYYDNLKMIINLMPIIGCHVITKAFCKYHLMPFLIKIAIYSPFFFTIHYPIIYFLIFLNYSDVNTHFFFVLLLLSSSSTLSSSSSSSKDSVKGVKGDEWGSDGVKRRQQREWNKDLWEKNKIVNTEVVNSKIIFYFLVELWIVSFFLILLWDRGNIDIHHSSLEKFPNVTTPSLYK